MQNPQLIVMCSVPLVIEQLLIFWASCGVMMSGLGAWASGKSSPLIIWYLSKILILSFKDNSVVNYLKVILYRPLN